MTALIIGLIAALGIGGGVAIANNSGGHGGSSSPAIVETSGGIEDYNRKLELAVTLEPDENLISALTDRTQYTRVSFGGQDSLTNPTDAALSQASAAPRSARMLKAPSRPNELYVDSPDFNGGINDGTGEHTRHLSLTDRSGIIQLTTGRLKDSDRLEEKPDVVYFTNDSMKNEQYAKHFTDKYTVGEIVQQNDLYLGGSPNHAHLTVADFGFWTEYRTREEIPGGHTGIITEYPIFLYDTRFLYAGGRTGNPALTGNVLMIYEDEATKGSKSYDVYGGEAHLDLDLAKGNVSGSFEMDTAAATAFGLPAKAFDCSFEGTLKNSQYTQTRLLDTDGNDALSNGGKGQLLIGKYGLEMVGIVDRRWEAEGNSAQYVFGAREH